ncbi:MAG: ATP-binding cassette domain-containing protein, partial [Gemmatimonadetes bacterium]|nr:ATP-binding cassette domain-containing protein [Gemmatimonadota bacterium]
GADITRLPPNRRPVNTVFQSYALFPHLTVTENVAFGLRMQGTSKTEVKRRVEYAAELVQLGPYLERYSAQLSGGQRQRVAIARALVGRPSILLADEPTGNLDSKTSAEIMTVFDRLRNDGNTIIVVTHEADIAAHAERQIHLLDGRIESDTRRAAVGITA